MKSRIPSLALVIPAALVVGMAMSACDLTGYGQNYEKNLTVRSKYFNVFRLAVPSQTIPGSSLGGLAGAFALPALDFPFSQSIVGSTEQFQSLTAVNLQAIGIRTLLKGDDADHATDALVDESKIGQCQPGQDAITFIHSAEIWIQKSGDSSSATRIASYSLPQSQWGSSSICGFVMQTDPGVNLLDFLPDYQISFKGSGQAPSQDVEVGGYTTLSFTGGSDVYVGNAQSAQ